MGTKINRIDDMTASTHPEFIGRRDTLKQIYQDFDNGETTIVLKGPENIGKSAILTRVASFLKKKKYHMILMRGKTSAEMILKKIIEIAIEKGINDVDTLFESLIEYKVKLEKILDLFLFKTRIVLVFEDFDENQDAEGELTDERLKELLNYLNETFKEKYNDKYKEKQDGKNIEENEEPQPFDYRMIFLTPYDVLKFPSITIEPLSWVEFEEMISNTTALKRMDKKSLKRVYFDIGGYPWAVVLLDKLAVKEFGSEGFNWVKLRDKVPQLSDRILHRENEGADYSYLVVDALLNSIERNNQFDHLMNILNSLSIFNGRVSKYVLKDLGVEITPADRKKLEALGLLYYSGQAGLYGLPRLVASRVSGRMTEKERREKHLAAGKVLETRQPRIDFSSDSEPSADETRTDQTVRYDENDLEALRHYIEAGEADAALELVSNMDIYYCRLGYPQFALDLVKGLEKCMEAMSESGRVRVHNRLAVLFSIFGKLDEALEQNDKALKISQKLGDSNAEAVSLGQMGFLYEAKGKDDLALEYYQKSLDALKVLGNKPMISQRLDQVGVILKRMGNYDDAFNRFREALEINRELNNQRAVALNLEQLGRVHDEQMKFDEALEYYSQSLAVKEALEDRQGAADLIHQMGNVSFVKGNPDEALSYYERSLVIKEAIGDAKGAGFSLGQIGLLLHKKDRIDEALEKYGKSLEMFEKVGEQKGIASGNHQMGRIYEVKGERDKALAHYEKSLEIREKVGDMLGAAITYGQLGLFFFEKEDYETALRNSTKAYAIFMQYGSPNAEISKRNMIRIKSKVSDETFFAILKEFNIAT